MYESIAVPTLFYCSEREAAKQMREAVVHHSGETKPNMQRRPELQIYNLQDTLKTTREEYITRMDANRISTVINASGKRNLGRNT